MHRFSHADLFSLCKINQIVGYLTMLLPTSFANLKFVTKFNMKRTGTNNRHAAWCHKRHVNNDLVLCKNSTPNFLTSSFKHLFCCKAYWKILCKFLWSFKFRWQTTPKRSLCHLSNTRACQGLNEQEKKTEVKKQNARNFQNSRLFLF